MTTALSPDISTGAEAQAQQRNLKAELRRSQRRQKIKALLLTSPLFIFILSVFVTPIGIMLMRSVDNPELNTSWPQTAAAIESWDGKTLPDDHLYALLANDIRSSKADKSLAEVGKRLNYERSGMRSLVTRTGRKLARMAPDPALEKERLLKIHKKWGELETWQAIKRASGNLTSLYLLGAVDMKQSADGGIEAVPEDQAIYKNIFMRTLWISAVVTGICLAMGFPLAWLLANTAPSISNLLMIGVLLPFWTSLLVRTSAWVVLLQKNGLINNLLIDLSIISEPLILLFNRPGVYIALVHLLLPFMVLSLYSVMKSISPVYVRAALSLGATPTEAFFKVYVPQTLPGIAAGGLLCFILSIGYYITPALIGSPQDQMISYFIAYYTNDLINWGMASALGVVLLACCGLLFLIYHRLSTKHDLKMG